MISQLVDLPPGLTTASATSRLHLGPQACFPPWVTSPLRRSLQPPPQPSSPLPPALSSCEYKTFIPPPCFLCPCGVFFVAVFSSWALRSVLLPKNTVSEQQRSETSDASWPEGSCCVGNGEKYAIVGVIGNQSIKCIRYNEDNAWSCHSCWGLWFGRDVFLWWQLSNS